MPLMTESHFFEFRAGIRPGNAVFTGFDVAPNVFASALAMSTSNPTIPPLGRTYSMGGKDGSTQNVKVVALPPAPADPAVSADATTDSSRIVLRMASPPLVLLFEPIGKRVKREQL